MLVVSRVTQVREEFRSSDLRQRSKIKDAVLYAKQSKIRCAGHMVRVNGNRWTRAVSDMEDSLAFDRVTRRLTALQLIQVMGLFISFMLQGEKILHYEAKRTKYSP
ncbi:unnamed protein product [Angiostrongylus costaricensis]|uniref:Zinc finger, CCHC-type n=1 Tax=Angiostrongylus costaricensis TaxID=334426 RepID=A0A0R3PDY7_ANGCS|nr:unnamed protein product [Angiostrongylus costaricensis]